MTRTARRSFRTRIGIGLAAAGAATALLMSAKPAAGAVVTEMVVVPNDSVVSAVATCPKGQRATGGGVESTPRIPGTGGGHVLAQESRKVGQRDWLVTAARSDAMPAGVTTTMTAIAYCLKKGPLAPKTKEVVAVATSSANFDAFTTADAVCPSGRAVQAGGFSQPTTAPNFEPFGDMTESYRLAEDTWRARMLGDPGAQIASYAYCAKRKAPTEQVGAVQATGPPNVSAVSPPCGKSRKAVAGGFSQPSANANDGLAFGFFQLSRVGKAWQSSAGHFGVATQLNSIVYCVKKP